MTKATPKKSGRRGPMPLDPNEDFERAKGEQPPQLTSEHLATDNEPEAIAQVENGMVLMEFVRVKPKMEGGKRMIGLELSIGLTDESAPFFGDEVRKRYELLRDDEGITSLSIDDETVHTLDIALASDIKPVIHAQVVPYRVALSAVQQKGSGEERTVIRLSFVAPIPQDAKTAIWALENYGELVWVSMRQSQGRLAVK